MKKIIIIALVFISTSIANAQVPNGSFEDSTYGKYPTTPFEWNTPNELYTELDDPANSYIEMYTDEDGSNPVNIISDTHTLDFDKAKGFAINGRPDSLIVWMTYGIPTDDTLIIRTKNRETQNAFGYGELRVTGNQFEMTRYAIKINYTSPGFADSGVIQAYVTANNTTDGHWISIESFEFINFIGQPLGVIPNAKFNDWAMDSLVLPTGWIGLTYANAYNGYLEVDASEKFTSDASVGNQAMILETVLDDGEITSGILAAIDYSQIAVYDGDEDDPEPMFPVSKKYVSLLGDYKLVTTATDTAEVFVAMFSNGNIVAMKNISLDQTMGSSYVGFEIHMDYDTFTGIPDSSAIFIHSSKGNNGVVGTQLYIDNLRFAETTSINSILPSDVAIYPNPTQGILKVQASETLIKEIQVLNLQGKLIEEFNFKSGTLNAQLNLSNLPTGVYSLGINAEGSTYHHKIIIEK